MPRGSMQPLTSDSPPRPGDVLHHPAFGFATVEERDASGAILRWEHQGSSHPVHVRDVALEATYRRCLPDGLLARSVRDPDETRALFESEPLGALAMLLAELGGTLEESDLRDWLLSRRWLTSRRFEAWWAAVRPLADADLRFRVRSGAIELREDVDRDTLLVGRPAPLPPPGTLPAGAVFSFGLRLARALAEVHAAGQGLVPDRGAVTLVGDAVRFRTRGAPTATGRKDDVRFVVRLLVEQVVGSLPSPAALPESDIPPLLAALPVQLPLEVSAIVLEAFAVDPTYRPADGFALWERLHLAERSHALRQEQPWVRQAGACAGFNTHIGVLKSLQSQTNQDSFLLAGDPNWSLLCVADGISQCTAGSGDLASGLTTRTLRLWWGEQGEGLRDAEPPRMRASLEGALHRANTVVCEAAMRIAGPDADHFVPMGTTVIAALTRGNRVQLAALGDSRAYLVGRFGVAILTFDQNLQAERFRDAVAGRPARFGDSGSPLVGYVGHFTPDGDPSPAPLFQREITLLPGEWLVLCSDGLSDYGGSEEASIGRLLAEAVRKGPATSLAAQSMDICRELVDAANRGGGGDNVTVLALTLSSEYGPGGPEEPVPS